MCGPMAPVNATPWPPRHPDRQVTARRRLRHPVGVQTSHAAPPIDRIIAAVVAEGRTLLTEYESKKVLAAYGIPITDTELAQTPDEAVAAAGAIGYPVVAKLLSRTITHKTDVGGVILNLVSEEAVRGAFEQIRDSVARKVGIEHFEGVTIQPMINWTGYELIVGSSPDAQFGPVLLFGMGGQLVEVFKDRALALPPLNMTLAKHLIAETTIAQALDGVRGRKPIDREVLAALLVRIQRAGRGAAAHRRDRHQPAAGITRADHRPRRPGGPPPGGDRGRGPAATGDPPIPE